MKYLALLFLIACKTEMPMRGYLGSVCVEEGLRDAKLCGNSAGGGLLGGLGGALIFGPVGAVIGAVAGSQGTGSCIKGQEPYCVKYEKQWKPNPQFDLWCHENAAELNQIEKDACAKGSAHE